MKQFNVFIAALVITCFSMVPAIAKADDHDLDDLDVTMDVVDDPSDIDDVINEMPGPEETDLYLVGEDDVADEEVVADEESDAETEAEESDFDRQDDEFETDEDFTEEDENFANEGDFEEGEEVDSDEYDMEMD